MTQQEIIELARQAGVEDSNEYDHLVCTEVELVAFAKLVAAKEREACAMLCLWHNNTMSQNPTLFHMAELIRARTGDKE